MNVDQLNKWKKDLLGRLDILKSKAQQARQYMEVHEMRELRNKDELLDAWRKIEERFPDDLKPPRVSDLRRHLGFAELHDFYDIETFDIPQIEAAVQQYGCGGDEFIRTELTALDVNFEAWELLHPQIRDSCKAKFDDGSYKEAARAAVELIMDVTRKFSGRQDDGDALIRNAIGPSNMVGFSTNTDDNEQNITSGYKLILQGLFKGVRNPTAHGYNGFTRLETFQILVVCSFVLARMRVNGED